MIRPEFLPLVLSLLATVAADSIYVDNKLVPDPLPNTPQQTLEVEYSNGTVNLGNELTPTQVHTAPKVKWNAEDGALYTLMMTDPDSLHVTREFLHWLVVNVKGGGPDLSSGVEVAAYQGAGPPPGTGAHRYVLSVWKQNRTIEPADYVVSGKTATNESLTGRLRFNTAEYVSKITGVQHPTPVAGNWFVASFDDYVKFLQEKLNGLMASIKNDLQS